MSETEEDPWASLRNASQKPEAGRFAYNDEPPERARSTAWGWFMFWVRTEVWAWVRKQFPLASKTLDSTYYLGITRQKKAASNVVSVVLGKQPQKEISRTPVIILGRRIGLPGLIIGSFLFVVVFAVVRSIFNF